MPRIAAQDAKRVIGFRTPEPTRIALQRIAEERGISVSDLLREVVETFAHQTMADREQIAS